MRTRRQAVPLVLIVLVAVVGVGFTVAAGRSPQLGLDLQGGFSVVLSAKGNPPEDSVEKAKEIIRQRIDGLGVAEPEVTRQGDNVIVQLPGVRDRKKAQAIVGRTAKLEFRPVLQAGLPYDKEADLAAGEDPCQAAAAPGGETPPPSSGAPSSTSPPLTTAPPASGAPETTGPPPSEPSGDQETGAPAPVVPSYGESAAPALPTQDDPTTTAPPETTLPPATTAPPGTTAPPAQDGAPSGDGTGQGQVVLPTQEKDQCLALGPVGFEGSALSSARAEIEPNTGEWQVSVNVKGSERDVANEVFAQCFSGSPTCPPLPGGQSGAVAIVLDEQVVSFPRVNGADLANETFSISGEFSQSEAKDLALVLRYGALPVEFVRSAEQQVSATLGRDSLDAGIVAGIIGLAAVALYMLVYYRGLGLVVLLGLTVWAGLMYTVISDLSERGGLALTLAGVTGIIVSVGTTVDSYVVYFERLKDDVQAGKTVRSSTERGFKRAFRTILTADVSSFIGAFLLWFLTVGPVRGFAFFLGLSVILDVVVAYFFTRPLVSMLGRNRFFTEARFFGVARGLGRAPAVAGGAS